MNEKFGLIYRAYDSEGKSYIGQTIKGLANRIKIHYKKINDGSVFHNALLEKGLDEFKWEILEENIPEDKLLERERYWSKVFNSCKNGYNGRSIQAFRRDIVPWNKGKTGCYSNEAIKKMSDNNAMNNPEYRKKVSEKAKGRIISPEQRNKLSQRFKGKHRILIDGVYHWCE